MIRRLLIGFALVSVAGAMGVAAWMRSVEDDPAQWHVPLRQLARPALSNDYLVASPGFTRAQPDAHLTAPRNSEALLGALDRVAQREPRTRRIAGSPREGRITWVHRSALFGFPDYITAEADAEGWAVWSRSRYGRSDFGVNRARVARWIAAVN